MSEQSEPVDTAAAEAYEKHLVPPLFGIWVPDVVDLAAPQAGDHVLDVACGTGHAIRYAAERIGASGRAVGLDIDLGMITVARSLPPVAEAVLDWHCDNALDMPFENGAFDVVVCLQGLQFFPDQAKGLAEIHRVLKNTGRFAASVWRSLEYCKGHDALAQALENHNVDAGAVRRPFSLGDAEVLRALVQAAGFREVAIQVVTKLARFASPKHFVDSIAAGAPSSRHALAQVPESARSALIDDVSTILQPYVNDSGVAIPTECHIVLARP